MQPSCRRFGQWIAVLAMMTLWPGCTRSLHPLYREADLTFDSQLLGIWAEEGGKETWTLQKSGAKAYVLTSRDEEKTVKYDAHLLRLGKFVFLDLYPKDADEGAAVAAHLFFKVLRTGNTAQVAGLDESWLKKMAADKKLSIAHVLVPAHNQDSSEESIFLTASTQELQEFVLKYAENTEAFSPTELHRRK